jgi:hypothetical protein
LKRAEHYRLLNDPAQAESICRDVLRVRPDDPHALITIILAITDQFAAAEGGSGARVAREYAAKLSGEYERAYYTALIREREARALLTRGMASRFAYEGLREAMALYERAERSSPEANDDAVLRWNSCVRTIRRFRLGPRDDEEEFLLE